MLCVFARYFFNRTVVCYVVVLVLISSVFTTVDPVDAESSKMDFSLATVEGPSRKRMRVECKCGVESCRKYLF